MSDLKAALATAAADVEKTLDALLPGGASEEDVPEARVFEAMRYTTLDGGKRLRPFLVLASADLFGVRRSCALRVGAAIEFIHCYSLVHDDMPCMDDDDLRRGKPTVHKKWDEATAVLAGDALQTLAFEVLADPETHEDPNVRCELVAALARAAGGEGMVGGQMFDLAAEDLPPLNIGEITRLQQLKTGRLFAFSCEAGAILGKADPAHRHALQNYAHDMGLAFQIADDILDVESDAATLGKATQKDAEAGKATFISILGLDRARAQAEVLAEQAAAHLDLFDEKADLLKDIARYMVERKK